MSKNYENIGLDSNLRKVGGVASNKRKFESATVQDATKESSPFLPPTQVSKGTVIVTGGGVLSLKDEGGTTVFDYNVSTGNITVYKSLTVTGNLTVDGTQSIGTSLTVGVLDVTTGTIDNFVAGTAAINYGTISGNINVAGTQSVGTITAGYGTVSGKIDVAGTATFGTYLIPKEILMKDNTGNKIRENYGLGLALADKVGANAVRIQNSDLTDLIQFNSKGGMTFIPQASVGTPDEGQTYYDSDVNKLLVYTGTAWGTLQFET